MLLIKVEIFVSALSFMKEKIVYQECQVGSQVNYLQRHYKEVPTTTKTLDGTYVDWSVGGDGNA